MTDAVLKIILATVADLCFAAEEETPTAFLYTLSVESAKDGISNTMVVGVGPDGAGDEYYRLSREHRYLRSFAEIKRLCRERWGRGVLEHIEGDRFRWHPYQEALTKEKKDECALSDDHLNELAKTHRPPQEWYDQEEEYPF